LWPSLASSQYGSLNSHFTGSTGGKYLRERGSKGKGKKKKGKSDVYEE
jgi:hypothetical protein